jgi:hypothetical protein
VQIAPKIEEIQILKATTALLRDLEYEEAIRNLKQSCMKNIALGDSSTKYFFNIFKPKSIQALMTELTLPNGELVTEEKRIVIEVHKFYSSLYSTDPGFKEGQQDAFKTIFEHLKRTLTD